TRSGGRHLVYRHAAGLRCSQSVVAPGVDVRADGGYVIFWPMHGFAADDRPLADWPQWLVKASAVVGNPVVSSFEARMPGFHTAHVAPTQNYWSRLNSVTARLSTTPPGSRGRTLNWAALVLGNMIAECGLGWYDAEARLIAACKQNGLWGFDGEREVRREIERGLSFGIRCWRDAVQSGIAACG